MKILERRKLDRMPMDRWNEGSWSFVHATGYEALVQWADGSTTWEPEYEDEEDE